MVFATKCEKAKIAAIITYTQDLSEFQVLTRCRMWAFWKIFTSQEVVPANVNTHTLTYR
eukprot:c44674_g1_i1 orf=37-213(-)